MLSKWGHLNERWLLTVASSIRDVALCRLCICPASEGVRLVRRCQCSPARDSLHESGHAELYAQVRRRLCSHVRCVVSRSHDTHAGLMISVLPVSQGRLGSCITPHPRISRFDREFDDISMSVPPPLTLPRSTAGGAVVHRKWFSGACTAQMARAVGA